MCLSVPPTAAFAEGEDDGGNSTDTGITGAHTHCVRHGIGTSLQKEAGHTCEDVTFTEWTSTTSLPSTAYLSADVSISSTWKPAAGTVLCLNGHNITLTQSLHDNVASLYSTIYIDNYDSSGNACTFTLTDCASTPGKITHAAGQAGSGVYCAGGGIYNVGAFYATFNMYGGNITENTIEKKGGGGVYLHSGGAFRMYGGTMSNNKVTHGGRVSLYDGGFFTMTGGTVGSVTITGDKTVGNLLARGYGFKTAGGTWYDSTSTATTITEQSTVCRSCPSPA